MQINKKYLISGIILLIVLIASSVYYFNKDKGVIENTENQQEEQINEEENQETPQVDVSTKEKLSPVLKESADKEDYDSFAKYLKVMYQNQWESDQGLVSIESEAYVNATTKYYDAGNIDEALRISSLVYSEVPSAWRFRYLRIRCLEKIGRDAFNENDIVKAEEYANKILQMMFRAEGANLLGDVYIKKIENNLKEGDKQSAVDNLNYIWDYELSQDRRDKLNELKQTVLGVN